MSVVHVWPRVYAEDVLAGASAEELAALESRLLPFIEYTPDLNDTQPVRIVRALARPVLEEGTLDRWLRPYRELGLDGRWLEVVQRLRIRNLESFCEAWEIAGDVLDTRWVIRSGMVVWAGDGRLPEEDAPGAALYTLRLSLTVPPNASGPNLDQRQAPPAPVRPLGARQSDLAEVEALARFLAPKVEATFNGAARLRDQPLLAPICALAGTVWTAMQHPKMQTKHTEPRYKKAAFYACLDALALGEHRVTAERILRRDHPAHIHIDASGAPEHYTDAKWRSGLGMFAQGKERNLIQVTEHNRKQFAPVILLSLAGDEPW
jgi:hypothetical protein